MRHTRIGKLTAEIRKISICKNISIILQHLIIHIENRKKEICTSYYIFYIWDIGKENHMPDVSLSTVDKKLKYSCRCEVEGVSFSCLCKSAYLCPHIN